MINTATVEGYVCGRIETRATRSGREVTSFSLNCPKRRNVNGEWQSQPRFFECQYWHSEGQDFRAPQIVEKAHLVVTGELEFEQWESNGSKRSKTLVNVRELVTVKPKDGYAAAPAPQQETVYDADIPF